MAVLRKAQLLHTLEDAIRASGWGFLHLTPAGQHPARYQIYRDSDGHTLTVYIWNITHGGGTARPADEYRIQVTA